MPLKIGSVSAAQFQQQQKPAKQKSTSPKISARKPSIIGLAAYGGKLFEPTIKKDKPIVVHFEDYFCEVTPDFASFVRFSTDGFFALRYFPQKESPVDKCILYYFKKAIQVSRESTIAKACEEAMIFEFHEFEGVLDEEGKLVSSIYEARDFIKQILQERIIAEAFLKRQQRIKEEEKQWQAYFVEQKLQEEEDEREDEKFFKEETKRENTIPNQSSQIIEEISEVKTNSSLPSWFKRSGK